MRSLEQHDSCIISVCGLKINDQTHVQNKAQNNKTLNKYGKL